LILKITGIAMKKLTNSLWLGAVLTGILKFIAVCQFNFLFGLICYIPLFIAIQNATVKDSFKKGFISGLAFAAFAFYWMVAGAERFTGYSIIYGFIVFLISAFLYALFCGITLACFTLAENKKKKYSFIINSILAAAVFCIFEWLLMLAAEGFPWFASYSGNAFAANLYAVQPASFFGVHILTFIVVLVNSLAASFIVQKQWKKLFIPVAVVIVYFGFGFLTLQQFDKQTSQSKPFTVAILAENILPDIQWDDKTGNELVERLLKLNSDAAAQKPDVILWSESAVPWTYSRDDDFLKEVFKITASSNATHIMGINTEYQDNEVYNSVYCLLPNGDIAGRYDKQFLLSLIEKPVGGLLIPFFSSKGFYARNDTVHNAPLNTPYGKAGIMVCNESAVPEAASNEANKGAEFFMNLSNDGWFNNTYIVDAHFYYARLRAVETRKDIAVNCNNGISGLIQATGRIADQQRDSEPFVKMVTVQPNNYTTLAISNPLIFIYCCALYVLFFVAIKVVQKFKRA